MFGLLKSTETKMKNRKIKSFRELNILPRKIELPRTTRRRSKTRSRITIERSENIRKFRKSDTDSEKFFLREKIRNSKTTIGPPHFCYTSFRRRLDTSVSKNKNDKLFPFGARSSDKTPVCRFRFFIRIQDSYFLKVVSFTTSFGSLAERAF